jgi:choline dehydrogenase-like flavoprotein
VTESVDVLIVGSGPVGCAFARVLSETRPELRVLMVEAGPRVTEPPGVHMKNIRDDRERLVAQVRSQGPGFSAEAVEATAARTRQVPDGRFARPGTFYVDPEAAAEQRPNTLPVAALSSNVGGMGLHWTCACPAPAGDELVSYVDGAEWQAGLADAQRVLSVTPDAFPVTIEGRAVLDALGAEFDGELPEGRRVQAMPLACRVKPDGTRHWAGADVILGELLTSPAPAFELRAETLCCAVLVEGGQVTGARLRDLSAEATYTVAANAVFAACDGLRTAQLLFASGVRPRALGRYLNDHIQLIGPAAIDTRHIARAAAREALPARREHDLDPLVGVFWIPYSDGHPVHGQVMHLDMSPVTIGPRAEALAGRIVDVAYFIPKEPRPGDRVRFSPTELDVYGMPKMQISHALSERDHAGIATAAALQARAIAALGSAVPGYPSRVLPAGSSLHYQGAVRMGQTDDGTSVCDVYGRVWGVRGLAVGGNGVIPTATGSNPTLTSVAHAVRAARRLAAQLP